jgi:hypothetical protein
MRQLKILALALLLSPAVLGCSGGAKGVPSASLNGEVKRMNGEPVGDVTLVFYPDSGPTAIAKTDASGLFTATVPIGHNRVAVIANPLEVSDDNSPEALAKLAKVKSPIKPQFATPETSALTVDVKPTQDEKVVFVVE